MTQPFTTGHAAFTPTARFIRQSPADITGPGLHHIAATTEEYRWVCLQLAKRRGRQASRRGAAKGLRNPKNQ